MQPESLKIRINADDSVSAFLYPSEKKGKLKATLILGHGAGAGQSTPFMRAFAAGLAQRGIDVLTFNFLYMEQGRKAPDPAPKLENTYRAVIDAAAKQKQLKGNRIFIGGKSMGGRIASQVAAQTDDDSIAGVVALGYPLHPPGRPDKLRDVHLKNIKVPFLIVQGSRDTFGTREEISATIKQHKLTAKLFVIEGGDHSLKAPKSSGSQQEIYDSVMDEIASWVVSAK